MIAFLVTPILGSSPVLINQTCFTEKIRFSSIYIKNMVIQVNSWIFGQVNHHIDEESCKFKLSKCVDYLTTFS